MTLPSESVEPSADRTAELRVDPAGAARTAAPKYWALKEHLREFASRNRPGTLLPAERRLAEQFGISRVTVRQALQELVVEGRVSRAHGRGTFVAPPKLTAKIALTSTAEAIREQGAIPTSRVLGAREEPAGEEIGARLEIPADATVVALERLRYADSEPMALDHSYFDAKRFPGMVEHLDGTRGLYEVLEQEYGVLPTSAVETIEAWIAAPAEAVLLEIETGIPLLRVERASYAEDGSPMEWSRGLFRGDRYRFLVEFGT